MSYVIAITGKGGVGKTTVAGLIVRYLLDNRREPVLAVDADPNCCLDQALGLTVETTIGGVREEALQTASRGLGSGQSKQELLELKIAASLVESSGFDLVAMGRPEGPGCYCYANNVLKEALAQLTRSYPYVVLDNEAGLENLSRRIVQKVDLMVMVSDASRAGMDTVRRLHGLATEMGIRYDCLALIINRLRNTVLPEQAIALRAHLRADAVAGLPDNAPLGTSAEAGTSLLDLPGDNEVMHRLATLLEPIISTGKESTDGQRAARSA